MEIINHCGTCKHKKGGSPECGECSLDRAIYGRYTAWAPATEQPGSSDTITEAIKHDSSKARYDLIPADALYGLAQMYTQGAEKYGDYNWELGMDWHRVYAALQRHANKWWRREVYDQEDGQHHLLSVIWCAMTLYAYEARGLGNDNRPIITNFNIDFWRNTNGTPTPSKPLS